MDNLVKPENPGAAGSNVTLVVEGAITVVMTAPSVVVVSRYNVLVDKP